MKTRFTPALLACTAMALGLPAVGGETDAVEAQKAAITAARAARDARQYDSAAAHYAAAAHEDPVFRDTYLGAALVDAERAYPRAALIRLEAAATRWGGDPEYWMALGYVKRLAGDAPGAVEAYRHVLRLAPSRTDARYELVTALQQAGRPRSALKLAREWSLELPESQRAELQHDVVAGLIRRAQRDGRPQANAHALTALGAGAAGTLPTLDLSQTLEQRRAFDLVVALRNAGRASDALTVFSQIEAAGLSAPPYALAAAADAHQMLRQPEAAEALYRRVNVLDPANPQARIGLFYALVDQDRFGEALAVIDAAERDTKRAAAGEFGARAAGSVTRIGIAAAMGRAYANRLPAAQRRLEALPEQDSSAVATAEGTIYRWRGWPRRALARYDAALAAAPQAVEPAAGRVNALLDLDRTDEAQAAVAQMQTYAPDAPSLVALKRDIALRQRPELTLDVGTERSSGSTFGSRGYSVRSALYGGPIGSDLRPVITLLKQQARFPEGWGVVERAGVGLDYRHDGWRVRGDATTAWGDNDRAGLSLQVERALSDHWWLGGGVEYNSPDMPLRGQRAGVRGNQLQMNTRYRWNERRRAGLTYAIADHTDSNQRHTIGAFAEQRLITSASYRLDGRIDLYGSRNRETNVAYYSPRRDFAADFTLDNRWRSWRHGDKSFEQRIALTGGSYRSTGHGNAGVWNIGYGHQWRLGPKLSLSYDVSRGRHVYDGAPEHETRFALSVDLRM